MTMDLTQLANLGEFIGGVAVLVTLIYLALQVRQANQNARVEGNQQLGREYQQHTTVMMDDQNLGALMKGLHSYSDLTAEERFKFDGCVTGVINLVETTLYHIEVGRLDEELTMQQKYLGPRFFAYPGFQEWWLHNQRAGFSESTNRWVDTQIEENRDTNRFWDASGFREGGR